VPFVDVTEAPKKLGTSPFLSLRLRYVAQLSVIRQESRIKRRHLLDLLESTCPLTLLRMHQPCHLAGLFLFCSLRSTQSW
jgi:hypothetical protein